MKIRNAVEMARLQDQVARVSRSTGVIPLQLQAAGCNLHLQRHLHPYLYLYLQGS